MGEGDSVPVRREDEEAELHPGPLEGLVEGGGGAPQGPRKSMLPFVPNQFACPCRLIIRFPIFHRVLPVTAIQKLESSVLHPFSVNNRVHTLVHRDRQGRVSYMKLEPSRKKDAQSLFPPGASRDQSSLREGSL